MIFALMFVFSGCGAALKQQAYIVGKASKETVDATYGGWDKLANTRIDQCVKKLPPEEHTKSEYDECVGIFNETTQTTIVLALDVVRTLQLALFITLSQNLSNDEVRKALTDLVASVKDFLELVAAKQ